MCHVSNRLDRLLHCLGCWPRQVTAPVTLSQLPLGCNLLPYLFQAWSGLQRQIADPAARETWPSWLQSQLRRQAQLTWEADPARPTHPPAFPGRLLWWPDGMCEPLRVGIVSSRLTRSYTRHRDWFQILRTIIGRLDPDHTCLVTSPRTTADRYVCQAAGLFGIPVLRVTIAGPHADAGSWFSRLRHRRRSKPSGFTWRVEISPPVDAASHTVVAGTPAIAQGRDWAMTALSDVLFVLAVRPSGTVHQLLEQGLRRQTWKPGRVWIVLGEDRIASNVARPLMEQGAIGWRPAWYPPISDEDSSAASTTHLPRGAPIRKLPRCHPWPYLTHWTRQHTGPWPDESIDAFLTELILDDALADRSALGALLRIISLRRILASRAGYRGGYEMVSFTEVPVAEFARRRVYRPHRGRWDFEPYGISIRRSWLVSRGARPVIYGNDLTWNKLADADRPYYQHQFSRSSQTRGDGPVDWSKEREWRFAGDVALHALEPQDAFVFVSSVREARHLAPHSPWPVVVLDNT